MGAFIDINLGGIYYYYFDFIPFDYLLHQVRDLF